MIIEDEWTEEISTIDVPLPRHRFDRKDDKLNDKSPFDLLQLFLPLDQMEEFVQYTNNAAPQDWKHTSINAGHG